MRRLLSVTVTLFVLPALAFAQGTNPEQAARNAGAAVLGSMIFMLLVVATPYIAFCVMNAMVASEKGRSVWLTLLASVFLTPVLVYLYVLAVPSLRAAPR